MDNSITGDFSVLSPSQKKELEQKRIRKAEAARKARQATKLAEEKRLAAIKAEAAQKAKKSLSKKVFLCCVIVVLCVLIVIIIKLWIHYFNVFCDALNPTADIVLKIFFGVLYFPITGIVVYLLLGGIGSGIRALKDKIKNIK